jgi:arylsulfatase A-like enzyme
VLPEILSDRSRRLQGFLARAAAEPGAGPAALAKTGPPPGICHSAARMVYIGDDRAGPAEAAARQTGRIARRKLVVKFFHPSVVTDRQKDPTMRRAHLCCIVALAALLGVSAPAGAQAPKRPNILFIMSDDHGYQALSCYGSQINQTPNLDRIATEGMRFDRCFVTNSICGPCRAVILTGKYSHLNGFARNGDRFFGGQQHVAKLLGAAGYQTAVVGKWHLESDPTGFDYWRILIGQGPYYNPPIKSPDGVERMVGYTTEIITDLTLDWLKTRRDPDRPFFLMYQHKAPHRNWMPGPDYLNNYDDVTIPEPPTLFDDYIGRGTAARNQEMTIARHLNDNDLKISPPRELNDEQRKLWDAAYGPKNEELRRLNPQGADRVRWNYQRYVKDYLRCVDAVDDNVGRVLDYLDESGLSENTLVVYTSDQGWYLGEHGWYDKRWMYEESFRTPLMVRWPGKIQAGSTNSDLTLNLDFPETFLEAAGLEIPDDMQGRSLVPLLDGRTPADWRQSVYYHYYEFPGPHSVAKHYGVRTDRYKLIHFYELDEWELYDLQQDPHELKSVYGDPEYADVLKRMQDELARLRKQYRDDGTIINFRAEQAQQTPRQLVQRFTPGRRDVQGARVSGVRGDACARSGFAIGL